MIKDVDYIVVGCGLAGIAFCEQLNSNKKSFVVFNNDSQKSSTVAGGLYNPVVLKRFTPVWMSKEQLAIAMPFYNKLEGILRLKLDYKLPVQRRFTSLEEQNNWYVAADKPKLSEYMSLNILQNNNSAINASFGFGEVLHSGRIDTTSLIKNYTQYLVENNQLIDKTFQYNDLEIREEAISYQGISAKYIVFSEGFGLKHNPYFNNLPLNGTKGELITIHAPNLNLKGIVKSGVFIFPLGNNHYKVGATYEWVDKTNTPTEQGKQELLTKLKPILNCDFKVIEQSAGIRPTVIDRRPLVGRHKHHHNLYVLNGLGTRGVMIAPYVAQQLYNFIEKEAPLNPEIDIVRFDKPTVS